MQILRYFLQILTIICQIFFTRIMYFSKTIFVRTYCKKKKKHVKPNNKKNARYKKRISIYGPLTTVVKWRTKCKNGIISSCVVHLPTSLNLYKMDTPLYIYPIVEPISYKFQN